MWNAELGMPNETKPVTSDMWRVTCGEMGEDGQGARLHRHAKHCGQGGNRGGIQARIIAVKAIDARSGAKTPGVE